MTEENVDPENYGAPPAPRTTRVDPIRDGWDIALCRLAVRARPAYAGDLPRAHKSSTLPLAGARAAHRGPLRHRPIQRDVHRRVDRCGQHGRRMDRCVAPRCEHTAHQALMTPVDGVRVVAHSADMTIEAIGSEGKPVVGVHCIRSSCVTVRNTWRVSVAGSSRLQLDGTGNRSSAEGPETRRSKRPR